MADHTGHTDFLQPTTKPNSLPAIATQTIIPEIPSHLVATERVNLKFFPASATPSQPAFALNPPAHGIISQRRVAAKDSLRAQAAARDCRSWRRDNAITEEVSWTLPTEWVREHHPGTLLENSVSTDNEAIAPEEVPFWRRWRSSRSSGSRLAPGPRHSVDDDEEISPKARRLDLTAGRRRLRHGLMRFLQLGRVGRQRSGPA